MVISDGWSGTESDCLLVLVAKENLNADASCILIQIKYSEEQQDAGEVVAVKINRLWPIVCSFNNFIAFVFY